MVKVYNCISESLVKKMVPGVIGKRIGVTLMDRGEIIGTVLDASPGTVLDASPGTVLDQESLPARALKDHIEPFKPWLGVRG